MFKNVMLISIAVLGLCTCSVCFADWSISVGIPFGIGYYSAPPPVYYYGPAYTYRYSYPAYRYYYPAYGYPYGYPSWGFYSGPRYRFVEPAPIPDDGYRPAPPSPPERDFRGPERGSNPPLPLMPMPGERDHSGPPRGH